MISPRQCLLVVITAVLLAVIVKSTQADTCMSRWLILSDISNKSVPGYEASLKSLGVDESNFHFPLHKEVIPHLLHHHPNDEKKFVQCIGKRSSKCWRSPPCGVGGKCLFKPKQYYWCKCQPGYTGRFCQNDVNECARGLHKCSKHSKCSNTRGSYTCRCKPGFSGNGKQCKEIDECRSQPCANEGTCHNHINRFTCMCKPGFKGKMCNQDIDECLSNPCKNNGTCFNKVNAFTCRCPIEYEGKTCEKRWFTGKLFKNINNEHANILTKVSKLGTKTKDNQARSAKERASILSQVNALETKSAAMENQLNSMTKKLDKVTHILEDVSYLGSRKSPGLSCLDIKRKHGWLPLDGFYWIKPSNYSGSPYRAYCDMKTQGGGWTLFATKVSYNFLFPATRFNPLSASSTTSNAKGCIHPGTSWSEVLFRFGPNPSPVRVIYSRNGGRASTGKKHFNKFLECSTFGRSSDVDGFTKYTPRVNGGRRTPRTGYHSFHGFLYHNRNGITFYCNQYTQNYVNLWYFDCGSGGYDYYDHSQAKTTKCIAGYCYLHRPVWLMYR